MITAAVVLDEMSLIFGARELARRVPLFHRILETHGLPPLWLREPGLRSLVHIVVEQKISLDSARAVMRRIDRCCPTFTAASLLAQSPETLVATGLSRRKAEYCLGIADAVASGVLDLEGLHLLPDDRVIERLVRVRGIGPWTAGVYLMMAMGRVDGWASGDRALAVAVAECAALDTVPTAAELDRRADEWRPWRGVAARLLWHAYLQTRQRTVSFGERSEPGVPSGNTFT